MGYAHQGQRDDVARRILEETAPGVAARPVRHTDRSWDGPRRDGLGRGELDGAGGPQAGGGLFPREPLTRKASGADLAAVRLLFTTYSTPVITPDLLAALAQVEGSGNPIAQTYWRWRFSWNPFEVYRPASSAVGMFQITDGTFAEAKRYCIHDHVVVEEGRWYEPRSCWFNALYTRVVPGHAVEMTAAQLDRTVARTLARNGIATASLRQQQNLAAVIHLCGSGAGDAYARRGFRFTRGQRCGDHDAGRYVAEVNALKRQFARLAGSG